MKSSINLNRLHIAALVMLLVTLAGAQVLREEVRAAAVRWLLDDCGLQSSLRDDLRAAASPRSKHFSSTLCRKVRNPPNSPMSNKRPPAATNSVSSR